MKFIEQKQIDILNYRIQQEQYSSKVYEQMSLFLQNESYIGMAKVWKKFADEELEHANIAKDYLLSFDIMPELMVIDEPINTFTSPQDVIQKTYDHECKITEECLELSSKAMEWQDWTLFALGQKYNEIQRIEMDEVNTLLDISKMTNDNLILDHYISDNF
jgi:ferritin